MTYFFSHQDLDGISPFIINDYFDIKYDKLGIIDYNLINNEAGELIFDKNFDTPNPDDSVIVVDFAVQENLYQFLCQNFPNFIWIDHHEETAKYLEDKRIIYNQNSSGTALYLEYVKQKLGIRRINSKLAKFVTLVDTYDRYDDESPLWEEAQDLNRLYYKIYNWMDKENPLKATRRFLNTQVDKLRDGEPEFYFTYGESNLIQEVKEKESSLLKTALNKMSERVDSKGRKFGVFSVASKVSVTAYEILKARNDLVYLIIFSTFGGMTGKASFRGSKYHEIDGNELFGFKGHKKACGGQFTPEFAKEFLDNETQSIVYLDELENDVTKES